MAVTIQQIADHTGLSNPTVSLALNKKGRLSARTRQRVLKAAKELNYRPNYLARGLRGEKTRTLGLILPSITGASSVTMDQFSAIESMAWDHGYRLIVGISQLNSDRERVYLDEFVSRRVDGLILHPPDSSNEACVAELIGQGVPLVTIESTYDFPTANVAVDREHCGYIQVKHLLEIGRRRIAFMINAPSGSHAKPKIRGYRRALQEAGVPLDPNLLFEVASAGPDPKATGWDLARRAVASSQPFDAIVTMGDSIAVGAMDALLDGGIRIPQDVALIGFDNEFYTPSLRVPLSTVHHPREAGRVAFDLLLEQLVDPSKEGKVPPRQVVLKPTLVARQSTIGDQQSDQ